MSRGWRIDLDDEYADLANRNFARVNDVVKAMRRLTIVLVVVLLMGMAGTWYTDHASCVRSNDLRRPLRGVAVYFNGQADRAAARAKVETGALRQLDLATAAKWRRVADSFSVRYLGCGKVVPDE